MGWLLASDVLHLSRGRIERSEMISRRHGMLSRMCIVRSENGRDEKMREMDRGEAEAVPCARARAAVHVEPSAVWCECVMCMKSFVLTAFVLCSRLQSLLNKRKMCTHLNSRKHAVLVAVRPHRALPGASPLDMYMY